MERNFQRLSIVAFAAICLFCTPQTVTTAASPQSDPACVLTQGARNIFGEPQPDAGIARAEEEDLSYKATWDEVCEIYANARRVRMDVAITVAENVSWAEFIGQMHEMGWICHPYDTRGISLDEERLDQLTPATNEHLFCRARGSLRNVLLDDVLIRGDVLGTGKLGPSQLVRLAHAVSGAEPLADVFKVAGDLNDNGAIDLGDLTIMAAWLKGENLIPPNVTYTIRRDA